MPLPCTRAARTLVLASLLALAGAAAADPLPLSVTARLLAGVAPHAPDDAARAIMATDAWQQHQKAARAGGRQLRQRLDHMNAWQAAHLPAAAHGATLLYPFSGPDFVNAYALFPDAERYVFFSLEPPGEVPALERIEDPQLAALLGDLRAALNDLVALNFFITPNMKENLGTEALQGNLPVLLAMMGLLDLQVDAVEPLDPWPERTRRIAEAEGKPGGAHPALPARGMRIAFTNPRTGRHQELLYEAIDVGDHALRHYPEFLPWLHSFERPVVFLKSASYLLHGDHFRGLRRQLIADAALIVQDDTGLPYHLVKEAGFDITLFGQYEKPVKLFEERYQPDLEEAYAQSGNQEPLPFPFGYNWRKEGRSGLLLAARPAANAAPAPPAPPAAH